jgi:hypothetical protein
LDLLRFLALCVFHRFRNAGPKNAIKTRFATRFNALILYEDLMISDKEVTQHVIKITKNSFDIFSICVKITIVKFSCFFIHKCHILPQKGASIWFTFAKMKNFKNE